MLPPALMLATKNQVAKFFLVIGAVMLASCAPPGARALLEGKRLLDQGKCAEAVEKLRVATSLLTTNANAWNYLGLAYHRAGQTTNAVKAYQKALKLNPDLVEVRYNLGCLWLEQNRLEPAKAELKIYTIRRANAPDGWLKLGMAQWRSREPAEAEKSFNEALRLNAQNPEALNGLGLIQLQRNRAKDAAQCFAAALKQRTNYAPALLNLAVVSHQHLNNHALALQKYREYLASNPRAANADAVSSVVRALQEELNAPARAATTGLAAQASQTTNVTKSPPATAPQVASAKPVKPEVATNMTMTKLPAPSPASQTTNLEVVTLPEPVVVKPAQDVAAASASVGPATREPSINVPTEPKTPTVAKTEKRGFLQKVNPANWFRRQPKPALDVTPLPPVTTPSSKKELAVATPAANVGASAQPAHVPSPPKVARYAYRSPAKPVPGNRQEAERAFAQGVQAQRAHRLAEAVQAYRQATQVDLGFFEAHYNLGLAAYEARNVQQALAAYENALAINPDSADARYNFALALRDAGYPQDAANELEKLLGGHPDEARAHFALANLYAQRLGQPQSARRHYLRMLEIEPRHAQATAIRYWLAANPE